MAEQAADDLKRIGDPFFRVQEGIAGAETVMGNRSYINFASYNYIGLNGDPRIAANRAISISIFCAGAPSSNGTRALLQKLGVPQDAKGRWRSRLALWRNWLPVAHARAASLAVSVA